VGVFSWPRPVFQSRSSVDSQSSFYQCSPAPAALISPIQLSAALAQIRFFGFGFTKDWDVGVGVFPECEEIIIGGTGFGSVAL
jgi:hypothetical protein